MASPFNTTYAIEEIKKLNGTVTFPPSLEEAYQNGYLTQAEYDNLKEVYASSNASTEQALKNAEAADKWFKEYEANLSTTQPVATVARTIVVDGSNPPSSGAVDTAGETVAPSNTASIVALVLGAVAVVGLLVAGFLYTKRRRRSAPHGGAKRSGDDDDSTAHSSSAYSRMNPVDDIAFGEGDAPWKDEALLAVRVPFEKIHRGALVSRGGFGEVYRAVFNGRDVAVKSLLPDKRRDVKQIKAFLAEIKFMSTLDHPRIVQFVGVAWESLAELCVVTEFMAGGDLRSLLASFEGASPPRPRGFDADKIQIALHVAHALTYLHSLQPVVLHRDLKSRNILLDASSWDAKLTDFGVSRERIDSTMTAGVGSSLWMAPEVMLGERYDEKADVFSFGVVLSELDTQQLPYADAREEGTGRPIPQTAILQLVSLGRLVISITPSSAFPNLQQLARDCVVLQAQDRPTAAEVLHRIHVVSTQAAEQGGLI